MHVEVHMELLSGAMHVEVHIELLSGGCGLEQSVQFIKAQGLTAVCLGVGWGWAGDDCCGVGGFTCSTPGRPAADPPCCCRGLPLLQYDFGLFSGLAGTITTNFFPKGDAEAAAIAFW
jgi:hypothetical protein